MEKTKKIVVCTGGFDPLHTGHIQYLNAAKQLGDKLVVGINSDEWLIRKKGKAFMPITERVSVVENLKMVDHCILFNDNDGSSIEAIKNVRMMYPDSEIIFANGGDRTSVNIPEFNHLDKNLTFRFGIGGTDKKNSSSWILEEWKTPKTIRPWGYYRILHTVGPGVKIKELTVDPGKSLSMQRHNQRSEFWFVAEGVATVYTVNNSSDLETVGCYKEQQHLWIPKDAWHQLANETSHPLKIIEIQYGTNCIEEDITRKNDA